MKSAAIQQLRNLEDTHWWYCTLRTQVRSDLRQHLPSGGRLLDAGCGTGGQIQGLQPFRIDGIDLSPEAVRLCHLRGLHHVLQGSITALPFSQQTFDAVLCLDVLYHEQVNDTSALAELVRVLVPGGYLLLNLPAHAWLRGSHDHAVGGARRYNASHVRSMLDFHNLNIVHMHYWNTWSLPLLLPWRLASRWLSRSPETSFDLKHPPHCINTLLYWMTKIDFDLQRLLHLPFGSSLYVLAQKLGK